MRLLLDTHLLIWAVSDPKRLSTTALALFNDETNQLFFSAASIWEIAIKASHKRPDFLVNVPELHAELLRNGYCELAVTSEHTFGVAHMVHLHKDPFDRLLLAQAIREDLTLMTSDEILASYPGPVLKV